MLGDNDVDNMKLQKKKGQRCCNPRCDQQRKKNIGQIKWRYNGNITENFIL